MAPCLVVKLMVVDMKLRSKDGHMIVDFYPVRNVIGETSQSWFLQVLTFFAGDGSHATVSKKLLTKRDMMEQANKRIHDYGYNVIDFNVIPQIGNPMQGAV